MNKSNLSKSTNWLALVIGNSRLHWAYFQDSKLQKTWNTNHLSNAYSLTNNQLPSDFLLPEIPNNLPLYIASVVPSQAQLWQIYSKTQIITLDKIPLKNLYPTMGIDRALAILGAGKIYGFPCLVIDAGTALTLTGVDDNHQLIGGAILPGLKLQFQSLSTKTAALPHINLPDHLPTRWAKKTDEAIVSGILYTVLGGIKMFINDWLDQFPDSQIILTGGDAVQLSHYFKQQDAVAFQSLKIDSNLIFWGMRSLLLENNKK